MLDSIFRLLGFCIEFKILIDIGSNKKKTPHFFSSSRFDSHNTLVDENNIDFKGLFFIFVLRIS